MGNVIIADRLSLKLMLQGQGLVQAAAIERWPKYFSSMILITYHIMTIPILLPVFNTIIILTQVAVSPPTISPYLYSDTTGIFVAICYGHSMSVEYTAVADILQIVTWQDICGMTFLGATFKHNGQTH